MLATLFIPELVEEHGTKGATVGLDRERVALAKEVVQVASADVKAAKARVEEAKAELESYRGQGRALGLGGQAAGARGRPGRRRSPGAPGVDQSAQVQHRVAGRGEGDHHADGGRAALPRGGAGQGSGRRPGRRGRPQGRRERGEAGQGAGRLHDPGRPLRRRDRRPQRQHLRLRPAHQRRPLGRPARPAPLAQRGRRAGLRGRPHRHRPHLRRRPRAGRQLSSTSAPRPRVVPRRIATSRSPAASPAPRGR